MSLNYHCPILEPFHCCRDRLAAMTSSQWRRQWFVILASLFLATPIIAASNDSITPVESQHSHPEISSFRRCFCNLPSCVPTGYMCKSTTGACFAQLSLDVTTSNENGHAHVRYACAENLSPETDRRACLVTAVDSGRIALRRRGSPAEAEVERWAETVCCATDMCNYYHFRSAANIELPDKNGDEIDNEGKQRLPTWLLVTKTTTTMGFSNTPSTTLLTVVLVSLGVALLSLATIACITVRLRGGQLCRHRTVWPPLDSPPLRASATGSAPLVEPLCKSPDKNTTKTALGASAMGFVEFYELRNEHRSTGVCRNNQCHCVGVSGGNDCVGPTCGRGRCRCVGGGGVYRSGFGDFASCKPCDASRSTSARAHRGPCHHVFPDDRARTVLPVHGCAENSGVAVWAHDESTINEPIMVLR